jgi:hypothetical protein
MRLSRWSIPGRSSWPRGSHPSGLGCWPRKPRGTKAADADQQLSYNLSYTLIMADTITFRPDEDTSKALEVLTKDGTPVSAVVRTALIDAARRKAAAAIRAEAEGLAEDESDRAEAIQVLRDMETLRAW